MNVRAAVGNYAEPSTAIDLGEFVQKTRSAKLHVAVYVFFPRTVDPCRRITYAIGRRTDDTHLEQRKEKSYVRKKSLGRNVRTFSTELSIFRWCLGTRKPTIIPQFGSERTNVSYVFRVDAKMIEALFIARVKIFLQRSDPRENRREIMIRKIII